MYIVIFCSLLALLLTYLDTRGMVKNGMFLGFVLITFLQVVHYDYGNDYMSYYNKYFEITQYDFNLQNILDKELYREPGWAILNYCFKPFGDYGFFMLVAVISTFQGIVIYKSIKKYVPNSQWPYAVFIYLFSTSLYLMEFTMLRQMLVMIIFIALWPLIERRKFVIPLIILYLCSFIHASSIILLPFTFWGFIPMGKYTGKIFTVIYLALFVTLFVYKDLIDDALVGYNLYLEVFDSIDIDVKKQMNLKVNEYSNEYEYTYMIYVKGALLFDHMAEELGQKDFLSGLKKVYKKFKFGVVDAQGFISCFDDKVSDVFYEFLNGESFLDK